MALPTLILIAGFWTCIFLLKRSIQGVFAQKSSAGEHVPKTGLAKTGLGNLSLDAALVAKIGSNAAPRADFNGLILRPTIGVRLISVTLTLFLMYLIWFNPGEFVPDNVWILFAITIAAFYGMVHTNSSYLRYNLDGFEVIDSLFRRHNVAWQDLEAIRDNGHYLYVFHLRSGKRLNALKFLAGMPEFLNHAFVEIECNN
ncbi:MAG: hypothetical protein ABJ370_21465 [Paracoccaceae bacterium]